MKLRESYEKEELGDFGTGEFNEEFVERDLNEEVNLIITIILDYFSIFNDRNL